MNFEYALSQMPGNVEYLVNRGLCYYDQRMYDEAIKDCETALNIKSDDPHILYRLGLAYYASESFTKCVRTLK